MRFEVNVFFDHVNLVGWIEFLCTHKYYDVASEFFESQTEYFKGNCGVITVNSVIDHLHSNMISGSACIRVAKER